MDRESLRAYSEFRFKKILGRGATAEVYQVIHEDQQYALKIFHPGLWDKEEFRKRTDSEFKALSLLKHPNIIRAYQAYWDRNPPAVRFEYIDGESLETFQSRLPYILPEISVLIVIEVLKALEYTHAKGVVHRDLKPANIFVSNDGKVLVGDFGLAKIADTTKVTLSGTILGSPDFISIEQAKGMEATERSDLYSAGAILYFLVTGTKPFSKSTPLATLAAVCNGALEAPMKRNPKISHRLNQIILKSLNRAVEDRYSSAAQFREVLETYLQEIGIDLSVYSFNSWIYAPADRTLEGMSAISHKLSNQIQFFLSKSQWDKALDCISHLTLLAPENDVIPLFSKKYAAFQKSQKRKKIAYLVILLIFIFGTGYYFTLPPQSQDQVQTTLAKTETVPVKPIQKKTVTQTKKRPLKKGVVQFDVAKEIKVYWNGRPVNPSQKLTNISIGEHWLRLEKKGSRPIVQKVVVSAKEPTVIRVQ